MYRCGGVREPSNPECASGVVGIEFIYQMFGGFNECAWFSNATVTLFPIVRVQIFNYVNSVFFHIVEQRIERNDLVC